MLLLTAHCVADSRRSRYRDHLEGGLEGSLHHREEESPDRYKPRQRRWETPTNILYVGVLPPSRLTVAQDLVPCISF